MGGRAPRCRPGLAAEPGRLSGPEGPRRRTRPSFIEQARRAQIVEAAIETIAAEGYARASIARIAERAGISPGLVSYHFEGKGALIAEVVRHVAAELDAAVEAATEGAASYAEALRGMVETFVRFFGGHRAEGAALGQIYAHARVHGGGEAPAPDREAWVGELEAMLREGQDEGELAPFDARVVAVTLLAALEAAAAQLHAHPELDADAYARELADLFEAATTGRRRRGRAARPSPRS